MHFAPILAAPAAVQIHIFTVVPAFVLGTYLILFSAKGRAVHRVLGYLYLTLMVVTSIAALFIHQIPAIEWHGLGPIHLFIPLTLFGVYGAIVHARRHNIRQHRRAMLGVYIGGLLIAGSLAFMPGRIMHAVMFGS